MTKHPLLNALLASLYIIGIVSLIQFSSHLAEPEESMLIPITMLSLFVLSAAVMGFLFLSQPLLLCFEGAKKEGVGLFLKTVLAFAGTTALMALALLFLPPLG